MIKRIIVFITLALFLSILLTSCITRKNSTYFNNLPDSSIISLNALKVPQPIIKVNDILSITIGGESEKTLEYIGQYIGKTTSGGIELQVSSDGDINLPKVGKIKVEGLTRDAAKDTITSAYSVYLVDPIISVDFSNFKFTVLGEVKSPGTFTVNTQQLNIFEAMAQCGDMTDYADRQNIKLLRDSAGIRKIITLDFTDKNILNSPYYYINRFDVLYIEPKDVKLITENFSRTATLIATVTSVFAIIFVLFKK